MLYHLIGQDLVRFLRCREWFRFWATCPVDSHLLLPSVCLVVVASDLDAKGVSTIDGVSYLQDEREEAMS